MKAKKLTPRFWLFVVEYCIDQNQTQAAIRAGYSPRSANEQAVALMKKPEIQAAIAERMSRRIEKVDLSADKVIEQLRRLVTFDPKDIFDEDGEKIKPITEWPIECRSAIAGMDVEEIWEWETDEEGARRRVQVGQKLKPRFLSRTAAVETAMKYHGLIRDLTVIVQQKTENTVIVAASPQDASRSYAELLAAPKRDA